MKRSDKKEIITLNHIVDEVIEIIFVFTYSNKEYEGWYHEKYLDNLSCSRDLFSLGCVSKCFNIISDRVILKVCVTKKDYRYSNRILIKFQHLTTLELYNNNIITDKVLKRMTNLTNLSLSMNGSITNDGIYKLTKLTTLNLINNFRILGYGFEKLTNITSLNLSDNKIIFNRDIANLKSLRILNINGENKITKLPTTLTTLSIESNTSFDRNQLLKLPLLTDLNASRSCVKDKHIKDLTNLTSLIFWEEEGENEDITDKGIENLTKLVSLYMNNNITDNGLRRLTNLTNLNTNQNITDKGIEPLKILKELNIGYNGITYKGVNNIPNIETLRYDRKRTSISKDELLLLKNKGIKIYWSPIYCDCDVNIGCECRDSTEETSNDHTDYSSDDEDDINTRIASYMDPDYESNSSDNTEITIESDDDADAAITRIASYLNSDSDDSTLYSSSSSSSFSF